MAGLPEPVAATIPYYKMKGALVVFAEQSHKKNVNLKEVLLSTLLTFLMCMFSIRRFRHK